MKKLIVLLAAIFLILSVTPNLMASAVWDESFVLNWHFNDFLFGDNDWYAYASVINFSDDCAPGNGYWLGYDEDLCYPHSLPGIQVPPDEINCAKLWIDGYGVDTDDNLVQVGGVLSLTLQDNGICVWGIDLGDNSLFDLSEVTAPGFWNGTSLGVCITAMEDNGVRIDKSVLMMNYETSPVPEPATMLMLGMGLLGTGFIFRRKK